MDSHFVIVVPLSLLSTCLLYLTQSFTPRVHLLSLLLRMPSKNMIIIVTPRNDGGDGDNDNVKKKSNV